MVFLSVLKAFIQPSMAALPANHLKRAHYPKMGDFSKSDHDKYNFNPKLRSAAKTKFRFTARLHYVAILFTKH
ncbi:hypothetical protein C5468_16630 [Photorhabdus luminescens subsp. mexicana]|uniref:Uncharacterized protein n=1 Tax=Photorhabdus luminescens subsp. mexicana TaxID=2100167 RepID=A0A4R4J575_PHOLU|nr:hypothetical protein C5468_16630 [Photorhabdus luminescens subsp. mexicana]